MIDQQVDDNHVGILTAEQVARGTEPFAEPLLLPAPIAGPARPRPEPNFDLQINHIMQQVEIAIAISIVITVLLI